jgi:deoxyribodipyrimidine photo-lyase
MHILWFRRDLRLSDNEIVTHSTADNAEVLPCFIIDPWFYQQAEVGKARVKFLFDSLENLDSNLREQGSQLYLLEGNSLNVIQELTRELLKLGDRPKLFFNHDVQVQYGIERDRQIIDFYREHSLEYYQGLNNFLQTDENCRDEWMEEYYTYLRQPLHPTAERINTPQLRIDIPQLTFSQLKQKYSQFWEAESFGEAAASQNLFKRTENTYFSGGETQAISTLSSFLDSRFHGYHWKISRPWLTQQGATSHLSPHLTFGTVSVRQVYQSTKAKAAELANNPKAQFSLKAFRDRLRWHDSFTQRLYFHPELVHTNRYPEFDEYYSPAELDEEKQELFTAWKEGQTGFPLVDASMRQLKTMGWMNFRMRAMCATFLCINCGISWHHGAEHYMKYLVDGDLAIDNWQWQMQAGVTNPLSDTFRIYNPNKNLEEKDGEVKFIYHWVEELRGYNLSEILNGAYLNESPYPEPILDWAQTRKTNGKIISGLRKRVKVRLLVEQGVDLEQAAIAKRTVEKYWENKDKQFREYQTKIT